MPNNHLYESSLVTYTPLMVYLWSIIDMCNRHTDPMFPFPISTCSVKRHEDIPQVKMFNPNLYKNKSHDMDFIIQIWPICLNNLYKKYKVHVIRLVFYKFG